MASNSSRKRRRRRQYRRFERKRERQASRQVMGGGHSRLVRPSRWGQRPEQPVVVDDGTQRRPAPKKREHRHKECYCPGRNGRKRHHIMRETRVVVKHRYTRDETTGCWNKLEPYLATELYELCAYCDFERSHSLVGHRVNSDL